MNVLAIDTSNELLGIAVQKEGKPVIEFASHVNKDHSSRLMPAIVDAMAKAELSPESLTKIVVAQGPGSYTGVRIGITTAKTMAWALDIPVHPVSSLQALAYNGELFDGYVWPFFDARRRAIFTGLYQIEAGVVKEVISEVHTPIASFLEEVKKCAEKILCLSPHIDVFRSEIAEVLGEQAIIPKQRAFHCTRPANYLYLSETSVAEHAHIVKPNYLRMTEAEANLQKMEKVNTKQND